MQTEIQKNARTVIDHTRKQIAMKVTPLAGAVYWLEPEETNQPEPMFTDGEKLYYNPAQLLQDYVSDRQSIFRQMLHIVLHGLQMHFFMRKGQNEALFDAAADAKTEYLMDHIMHKRSSRDLSRFEKIFSDAAGSMSLESLYLIPENGEEAKKMTELAQSMKSDGHTLWGQAKKNTGSGANHDNSGILRRQWEMLSMQAASEMAGSREWGHLAADFSEVYREINASNISYSELLKQFLQPQELQEADPDSINRVWYHVGLEHYGNIPLIEPDELREDGAKIELAVALDTSGSCSGRLMQRFLSELLSIVRDAGGRQFSLTLIQCDADVQHVQHLTTEDEVMDLLSDFRMYGGGGTDFCPVFNYLDAQKESPEAPDFRGLIYLSDGMGNYPDKAPDYPVYFIIPKEDNYGCSYMDEIIPPWVKRAYITNDGQLSVDVS